MESKPLSDKERQGFCEILYHALIELRGMHTPDRAIQSSKLAYALHNLPHLLFAADFDWEKVEAPLRYYQECFYQSDSTRGYDYLRMGGASPSGKDGIAVKSYFLAPIASHSAAVSALDSSLPGQGNPWLLKDHSGDVIAYFSLVESDGMAGDRTVQVDISGRHLNKDEKVVAVLRCLRQLLGGEISNDD